MTDNDALNALSPLDGRYAAKVAPLRALWSEAAFMRHRVRVEIEWLIALSDAGLPELAPFSPRARQALQAVVADFGDADAQAIKAEERRTNHDVKAVEYFLKKRLAGDAEVAAAGEFIHFACTSEDINNTSHALMLRGGRVVASGPLEYVMTEENVSETFGMPILLEHNDDRWSARRRLRHRVPGTPG